MDRVSSRLLQIPGIAEHDVAKSKFSPIWSKAAYCFHILTHAHTGVKYIMYEDALRLKSEAKDRLLEDDIKQYLTLCDRLQIEDIRLPYSFIVYLKTQLHQQRQKHNIDSFKSLLDNVSITVENIQKEKGRSTLSPLLLVSSPLMEVQFKP